MRVHEDRLDRAVGPLALSPGEALRLAREGRRVLVRRTLPPDDAPSGAPEAGGRDDAPEAGGRDDAPEAGGREDAPDGDDHALGRPGAQ